MDLTTVPLRLAPSATAAAPWADGMAFALPRPLVERLRWLDRIDSTGVLRIDEPSGDVSAESVRIVREFAAFTDAPPASARLPISYQRVPAWVRSAVASLVGRLQRRRVDRWAVFPAWPLDLTADLLADLAGLPRSNLGTRTPVLLTHDIDSPEGLHNLVADFLPLEEAFGARSASYIVPCAWPPDAGRLQDIRRRGHEIGVHGYDHSNRTPFAADDERRRRLDAAKPFADCYHALGYRAPSLLRTRPLIRDLASRYAYDSSIPTSGGLFPVPNNGCAAARPFPIDGIIEIPLTLPRDGSLRFLGYTPAEMLEMWLSCAERIARAGGAVVLLTHCERRFSGSKQMLDAYRRFVEYIAAAPARFAFSTPSALAEAVRSTRL